MKKIFLISLFLYSTIISVNSASAITVVIPDQEGTVKTAVTSFGLSGVIEEYDANQSQIVINGQRYILSGKGDLSESDLAAGQAIKYNVEQSPDENMGHVTRIWIEE